MLTVQRGTADEPLTPAAAEVKGSVNMRANTEEEAEHRYHSDGKPL